MVSINGKGNVNLFTSGKNVVPNDLKAAKEVKENSVINAKTITDNRFVKDLDKDLLTSNIASAYGVNLAKPVGEKIDKDFWGDALKGLKIVNTELNKNTVNEIKNLDNEFAQISMKNEMDKSPFINKLNEEFGI